jgi:hypothetical protein
MGISIALEKTAEYNTKVDHISLHAVHVKDPKVICMSDNTPGGRSVGSIGAIVEGDSLYGTVNDGRVPN